MQVWWCDPCVPLWMAARRALRQLSASSRKREAVPAEAPRSRITGDLF